MDAYHPARITFFLFAANGIEEIAAQFKVIKMEGKGKLMSNSNVTVISMVPSERINRRTDNESKEVEKIDSGIKGDNNTLLKLHILNIRTGKIQDAIISSEVREVLHSTIKSKKPPKEIVRIQAYSNEPKAILNNINLNKKFAIKPYKLRNKFMSTKCKCQDISRMWNCKKIQISIGRCQVEDQFLCCR